MPPTPVPLAPSLTPLDYGITAAYFGTIVVVFAVAAALSRRPRVPRSSLPSLSQSPLPPRSPRPRTHSHAGLPGTTENEDEAAELLLESAPLSPHSPSLSSPLHEPATASPAPSSPSAARDFYLADQSSPWWAVGLTFFASNIGVDAMIGLSSAGATIGLSASFFDAVSPLAFLALAYLFLPVYRAARVFTLPQYAGKRFGAGVRGYLACLSLVLYATNKVAAALLCGSVILQALAGVSPSTAIALLVVATGLFSAAGGLKAVIYAEVVNTILLLGGGATALGVALHNSGLGSWAGLVAAVEGGGGGGGGALTPAFLHLSRGKGSYALPGLLLGSPWLLLWFHAADQEMVQRGLSARSSGDAKLGSVLGGALKLTVPFLFCLPGIVARYALPDVLGCPVDGTGGPCAAPNLAYPALIALLLPPGLRGLLLAAALAGVLSILASTFNSAATLFAVDVWGPAVAASRGWGTGRRWCLACPCRPRRLSTPTALVWVGRVFILVLTGASILWLPLMGSLSPSLYLAMQSLNAYAAPPVTAVFVCGLLWRGANEAGALAALLLGHGIGLVRLLILLSVGAPDEGGAARAKPLPVPIAAIADSGFLLFAAAEGGVAVAALVFVSLATARGRGGAVAGPDDRLLSSPALRLARRVRQAALRLTTRRRGGRGGREGEGVRLETEDAGDRGERVEEVLMPAPAPAPASALSACTECGETARENSSQLPVPAGTAVRLRVHSSFESSAPDELEVGAGAGGRSRPQAEEVGAGAGGRSRPELEVGAVPPRPQPVCPDCQRAAVRGQRLNAMSDVCAVVVVVLVGVLVWALW
jgi:solute:Na+ symporter, SSS family